MDMSMIKLYLDPGHDLTRPGCSHNGLDETSYVYGLAAYLDAYMRMGPLCSVLLSRERTTKDKPYRERAQEAASWGADLAVCLHVNAMPLGIPGRGLMAFADHADALALEVAGTMARCAPAGLLRDPARAKPTSRTDWTRNAHGVVSPYSEHGILAVLVELGFATDERDVAILQDQATRPAFVAMILAGVATVIAARGGVA